MKIKKRFRYDVTKEVRKIEAEAWKNARALGFTTLAQIKRERDRVGKFRGTHPPTWPLYNALYDIAHALEFVQHFDRRVKEVLAVGARINDHARAAIAEFKAKEIETRKKAA